MDLKLVYQPEHHFRFFDFLEEPKKITSSINNDNEQISLVTLEEAVEPIEIFIPQVKTMVKLVKENCQQSKDNLSIDESASIMLYTLEWIPKEDSFYYIFNRTLHLNTELKSWNLYLKLILTLLSKLPIESHRIFYRCIQLDLKIQYTLDQIFCWYGFLSCLSSIHMIDKEKFNFNQTNIRTLFIIHSNHGKNISQHSFYKINNEILFPPGQYFQVISIRESTNKLCIIILKEVTCLDLIEIFSTMKIIHYNSDIEFLNLIFKKKIKNYSEINLRNQNLTDNHMNIIVKELIQKKKCLWLSLQNNNITSYGLIIIAYGLINNDLLESLYLSHNFITDIGIKYLTTILSNNYSNLTLLSLDYNCIKDEGMLYLADMLEINKTLTDLWLSYNNISDYGIETLVRVLTFDNTTLIQLYLHGNKLITDLCIDSLNRMFKFNSTLNTFWLHSCNLSKEGKEKLVKYRTDFDLYV